MRELIVRNSMRSSIVQKHTHLNTLCKIVLKILINWPPIGIILIGFKSTTMANTYTKCYFQLVFAVKYREAQIKNEWKDEMGKYITGITQNHGHKLLAIGGMPDHIHILIGYNLNQLIPDLVEDIKTSTDSWIKGRKLSRFRFGWQRGYGAFTYSYSQTDDVIKYILSQEERHRKKSFKEEYLEILEKNDIEFKEEYLFEFFDNFQE